MLFFKISPPVRAVKNLKEPFSPAGIFGKKGMAMLEILPVITMMFILLGASLGSWGIVHTAVLHSIAARNYTFFTLNNRTDISYYMDNRKFHKGHHLDPSQKPVFYGPTGSGGSGMTGRRFHLIANNKPSAPNDPAIVVERLPAFGKSKSEYSGENYLLDKDARRNLDWWKTINPRNKNDSSGKKAAPAWIMVGYGICLDANCGD